MPGLGEGPEKGVPLAWQGESMTWVGGNRTWGKPPPVAGWLPVGLGARGGAGSKLRGRLLGGAHLND